MNLRDFIESKVEKNPGKPFLYFEKEVVSYKAFDQKINQVANGFLELGVKKGDRVCLLLSNRPKFLYAWFGLAKIGVVMVPINTGFKESEAGYIANHSEAVGLILNILSKLMHHLSYKILYMLGIDILHTKLNHAWTFPSGSS